ncbi:transglycosylase SLT domain-containing protein [Streptomyces sp. MBT54]|uniref:transglycosylase SLT domain-containing protein n=1 Tax=Streptomyces sp. MBT54 TaxID=1488385 RepID=UPI00190DC2A4|nr:transglycosylase SLT domain-containing protein [Streptomyces sp. MBT54]MBK3606307.1 transglycosylase SLT domain-containing protein [Streptomyces sp. MBT54]
MSATRIPSRLRRLNKVQKISVAGVLALGVAALTFSLVPSNADAEIAPQAAAAADAAKAKAAAETKAKAAKAKAASEAKAKAAADAKDKAEKAAKAKADAKKRASEKANRSTPRKPVYANNLDGWIREAMSIMKKEGIPGSYEGIHRNIIRESSGNRWAINNWDINAQNGIPSKGLLQVIQPTFDRYHVAGTKKDLYDPVANIVAACNYAADRYGTMDNVDSAY